MPRPRTVSDDAILDVAVGLIGEGGPTQVTFAAVAERVGLAPATLVQRFGTKRGLLLAIARRGDPGRGLGAGPRGARVAARGAR